SDADAKVRLRAAQGFVAARDKSGVPALLTLLIDGPVDLARQAEEVLALIAGEQSPKVALGEDGAARRKCGEAWAAWWKTSGGRLALAKTAVDLPWLSQDHRARRATDQFLSALLKGDLPTIQKMTDVPFCLAGFQTIATREELDNLWKGAADHNRNQQSKYNL